MAKLKRILAIENVADDKGVDAALAKIKATCASGLAQGGATLTIEFDAPELEAKRRMRESDGPDALGDVVTAPKRERVSKSKEAAAS